MLNNKFKSIDEYLEFYGLKFVGAGYQYVPFKSNGFEMAGQMFIPEDYKATVIIVHGYLGHSGTFGKLIKCLIESGFAVAVFDLPGHGLSNGEPAAIDNFAQYRDSLSDFLKIIKTKLHGPFHIIGHSTGGSIIMDYLFNRQEDCFGKVILSAPLVRCWMWPMTKIGYAIYRPFAKRIFRAYRKDSSDKDYLEFVKHRDLLQGKNVPLKWVNALFEWNKKAAAAEIINRPILVIQGTSDTTVAWKYNLKFIRSKFKSAQIKLIEKGRHELFNESAEIRVMVFSQIKDYLEKQAVRPEELKNG